MNKKFNCSNLYNQEGESGGSVSKKRLRCNSGDQFSNTTVEDLWRQSESAALSAKQAKKAEQILTAQFDQFAENLNL